MRPLIASLALVLGCTSQSVDPGGPINPPSGYNHDGAAQPPAPLADAAPDVAADTARTREAGTYLGTCKESNAGNPDPAQLAWCLDAGGICEEAGRSAFLPDGGMYPILYCRSQ